MNYFDTFTANLFFIFILSVQLIVIKNCRRLDSNCGPTVPQPKGQFCCLGRKCCWPVTLFDKPMVFFKAPLPHYQLFLGSPMFMDPHLSQQHSGLQHAVCWPQQEVTRPKTRFKPTSTWSPGWMGEQRGANMITDVLYYVIWLLYFIFSFFLLLSHSVICCSFWRYLSRDQSLYCMLFPVRKAGKQIANLFNRHFENDYFAQI